MYHDEQKVVNQNYAFIIKNRNNDLYEIETKNKIVLNQAIEIISPNLVEPLKTKIISMQNTNNELISVCPTPMSTLFIKIDSNVLLDYPAIGRII